VASPPPRFDQAAADAVAAEVLARAPSAGLTIAVERRGEVLFARGYGLANVKDRVEASGETVYPICSISKNFAAPVPGGSIFPAASRSSNSPNSRYPKPPCFR